MKRLIAAFLLLMLVLVSCESGEGDTPETESEAVTTIDTTEEETVDPSTDDAVKEVDITDFIGLDRRLDEDGKPYLTKDDILTFDEHSDYIGAVPEHSYNGTEFSMFIGSDDRSMLGHEGFLYYPARVDYTDVIENTEEYQHEYYSPCYKYTGDGSDIPFGSDMIFVIQNASFNDYADVLGKIAELTDTDKSNIKIIHNYEYKQIEYVRLDDIPDILSIEDNNAVVDSQSLDLSTQALYIPQSTEYPFYIKADFVSEKHFSSDHNMYKDIFPGGDSGCNRIVIRVYLGNTVPESETEPSERYIQGTYICSSEYFSDGNSSSIPSVYFDEDGDCLMSINYFEGGCNMEGRYRIENDLIYVKLDFSNTIFEDTGDEYTYTDFISDECVFYMASDSKLIIDRGFYAVNAGDEFISIAQLSGDAKDEDSELISDKEAIELCIAGQKTVYSWGKCGIGYLLEDFIIKQIDDMEYKFYPVEKDGYTSIDPDIRGNTKIYYGDHEWMQENLRKIYTENYIENHFSYGLPWPFIYENGTVYFSNYAGGSTALHSDINYTVIYKTENEFAVVYETYPREYFGASEILFFDHFHLGYMKFVKNGDLWLIDAYSSNEIDGFIFDDIIPAEVKDKVPENIRNRYWKYDESDGVNQVDIMGFIGLDWRVDGGDGKEYVTKDEILSFDKSAEFRGANSGLSRNGVQSSCFEAISINSTFGGYECFVDYKGRIKEDSENIIAEENASIYGTSYSYIGDGSDVLFDPCMLVTVPNVTYNDYVSVLDSISETVKLPPDNKLSPPAMLSLLRDDHGADTVFTDFIDKRIYLGGIEIPDSDWMISIYLIDEDMLQGAQNEGIYVNPLSIPIYNRMNIYIDHQG